MEGEARAKSNPVWATDEAALRTLGQRRRRVWRSVLLVGALIVVMVTLSVMNRDQQAIDSCRERMEYAVREFQRQFDERGVSPAVLPLPQDTPDAAARMREHVLYNYLYTESALTEVGVCCCRYPHSRLFQPAGRHVITFNVKEGRYLLRWVREEEFRQQADDLGLRISIHP